jgi:ferredoxin
LNLSKFKKVRVWASLLYLLPVSLLFIDPRNTLPASVADVITSLQLFPSLIKVFSIIQLTAIGLIFVMVVTVLFGRVYCSILCPLGTLQDIIIFLKRKIRKRTRYTYIKPNYVFHYSFLGLTLLFIILGNLTLLDLLEPFSNYGRILTNLVEPIVTLFNNGMAGFLGKLQIYLFYDIPLRTISTSVFSGTLFFLAVVTYLSINHGRFFCNTLCPTGAVLSLLSRFTIYKIIVDESTCTECGACEKVCKANCINSKTKQIDFSACIGCFNCIKSCPTDGIIYTKVNSPNTNTVSVDLNRRFFFQSISFPIIGSIIQTTSKPDSVQSGYWNTKQNPISPPGSKSIQHFTSYCTACHLCVSECPTQVLYPSLIEYGAVGIFQPKMNYDASYCNYECTICGDVCPTGAILPLTVESKKLVQMGKAVFIKDDCVVVAKKKDCAACSEHCPTKAVHSVPYEGNLKLPELNNDICTGCGGCEHACPTTPRKAIYITSNKVHQQAQKPKIQKQQNIFDNTKDFPF